MKTPSIYQITNWSYGQKTKKRGGWAAKRGPAGVGGWGRNWENAGDLGEVHTKTPGLYQVPNWSYGQKTAKKSLFLRGHMMFGLVIFFCGNIGISGMSQGSSTQKPQVSMKSQSRVIAKKTAKNHHF